MGRHSQHMQWWDSSYIVDWVTVFFIWGFGGLAYGFFDPFERPDPFSVPSSGTETSFDISKPLQDDTVSNEWLVIIVIVENMLAYGLWQAVSWRIQQANNDIRLKWSWRLLDFHDMHHFFLTFMETMSLTFLITECLKRSCGRLRPDWLARLDEDYDLENGRQSFPSGHASVSGAAFTVTTLYLIGKLEVFVENGGELWKLIASSLPQVLGLWVCVTRTQDYKHHFSDILAGYIIGIVMAIMCTRLNYHNVESAYSGVPKSRIQRADHDDVDLEQ